MRLLFCNRLSSIYLGTDINVPPPTLNKDNPYPTLGPNQEDDGQYREDPSIYYKDDKYNTPVAAAAPRAQPAPVRYNPGPQQYYTNNVQARPEAPVYQPQPQPQHRFQAQPQQQYYQPAQQAQPQYDLFRGHPAHNVDINTGSYTLNYSG